MDLEEINEFRTTWNNEFFAKHKSKVSTAKYLIKKSIVIDQVRLCRQLKTIENDLKKQLDTIEKERNILKDSLANHLEQRLKTLENAVEIQNNQINNLLKQEKDHWKQLEEILAKRVNLHKSTSRREPQVVPNATYVRHVDKNNENLPPIESRSPVKVPKIRSKNKKKSQS